MTELFIVIHPNPILRKKTKPVENINDLAVQQFIDDMIETMEKNNGVGLAANQVASEQSIIVYRDEDLVEVLVNPEIVGKSKTIQKSIEGCLCIPGLFLPIKRYAVVDIEGYDRYGTKINITAEKQLANILQHEIDHLNGVLFIDRLSKLQRNLYKRKLKGLA